MLKRSRRWFLSEWLQTFALLFMFLLRINKDHQCLSNAEQSFNPKKKKNQKETFYPACISVEFLKLCKNKVKKHFSFNVLEHLSSRFIVLYSHHSTHEKRRTRSDLWGDWQLDFSLIMNDLAGHLPSCIIQRLWVLPEVRLTDTCSAGAYRSLLPPVGLCERRADERSIRQRRVIKAGWRTQGMQ